MIPLTRASGNIDRAFANCLAPSVAALRSHLPASDKLYRSIAVPDTDRSFSPAKISSAAQSSFQVGSARSIPATSRIFGLYGLTNTRKIIGPTVLRYVISRDFSGTRTDSEAAGKSEVAATSDSGECVAGEKIISKGDFSYVFTLRGEFYILSVLCWNVGYYSLDFALMDYEVSKALSDPAYLEEFARKVRNAPDQYMFRVIKWK